MSFDFLLAALLGYLLGSFPSGFLLVRWKSRKDIRQAGSGNVGALNSYLVTQSPLVGAAVLGLDLLKGMLAAVGPGLLFGGGLQEAAVAGLAAVVGHNFSLWLRFKGGRGLATAAGVALVLAWPIVPIWMFLWALGFLVVRDVNVGNAIATLLLIIAAMVLPSWMFERLVGDGVAGDAVRLFIVLIFGVILVKQIAPVREFVRRHREGAGPERTVAEAQKENP
jgi:acyl phosphate:glycerol-3-phosphate acyltransferase